MIGGNIKLFSSVVVSERSQSRCKILLSPSLVQLLGYDFDIIVYNITPIAAGVAVQRQLQGYTHIRIVSTFTEVLSDYFPRLRLPFDAELMAPVDCLGNASRVCYFSFHSGMPTGIAPGCSAAYVLSCYDTKSRVLPPGGLLELGAF